VLNILENKGDAMQTSFLMNFKESGGVSLHLPWTPETDRMVDAKFINGFAKPFWIISIRQEGKTFTADLVVGMQEGKIWSRIRS
jgi:D-3-phosphoglycerate dehydrogenase